MLEVKNIDIKFNNKVIENGTLKIKPYEITLLTGKSGTGKTSLLNILGLLDKQSQYDYNYNDEIISVKDMNEFQRINISYVFQDYNLIEDISIKENFKMMFNIAGFQFDEKVMNKLLEDVGIDSSKIKMKGKSLSGGEKQRVAIAFALVKKPKLLLLDEPTASLDEANESQIISILQNLKDQGMMIVVATHRPDVYHAQHIYEIKDYHIIDILDEDNNQIIDNGDNVREKFHLLKFAFSHISQHMIIYSILLLMMIGAMCNVTEVFMSVDKSVSESKEYIQSISDNEIVLINNKDLILEEHGQYYYTFSHKIDSHIVDDVSNIKNVETIYPYYRYELTSSCDMEGNDINPQQDAKVNTIQSKDKSVNSLEEFQNMLQIATCYDKYKEKQCYKVDEKVKDGVFISSKLAKALGITELNNTEITFQMPIFLGYQYQEGYVANDDGSHVTEDIPTYPSNILFQERTYKIQGIYENNLDSKFYDLNDYPDLYVDYREMQRLHQEVIHDKKIMDMYQKYMDYYFIKGHNSQFSLDTSLYIVRVDESENVENVVKEIKLLNYDINVKTKNDESSINNDSLKEFYYSILLQPIILLGVVIILIVIIYIYTLHQRKKELSFVKANGIVQAFSLPIIDMFIILMASIPITMIVVMTYSAMTGGYFTYNLACFMLNVIAVSIVLILCFIVNQLYYRKIDIISELRSK